MVRLIGKWYVDYRLDLAYQPQDRFKDDMQLALVYNRKTGKLSKEFILVSIINDLYKRV